MTQAHRALYEKILTLPHEKVLKVLSYLHFVEQESSPDLFLDSIEEAELNDLLASEDFSSSEDVLAKIMELKND